MCEFTGLDFEMEINEHYFEVTDVVGKLFSSIFQGLHDTLGMLAPSPKVFFCVCMLLAFKMPQDRMFSDEHHVCISMKQTLLPRTFVWQFQDSSPVLPLHWTNSWLFPLSPA